MPYECLRARAIYFSRGLGMEAASVPQRWEVTLNLVEMPHTRMRRMIRDSSANGLSNSDHDMVTMHLSALLLLLPLPLLLPAASTPTVARGSWKPIPGQQTCSAFRKRSVGSGRKQTAGKAQTKNTHVSFASSDTGKRVACLARMMMRLHPVSW